LEGFAQINNGVVMKEAFKNWKTISTSIPQEKGWYDLVN
jgi:hypothetical protein